MPEVSLKLLRFLQLNHPLTEVILFGFFLILLEARKITRYRVQQHKSCGKSSIRSPRQKNQAHKTIDLTVMTKPKTYSSLATILHHNIQILHRSRTSEDGKNGRHSCPHGIETEYSSEYWCISCLFCLEIQWNKIKIQSCCCHFSKSENKHSHICVFPLSLFNLIEFLC